MNKKQIAKILKENITFSGQLGDYVVHGAIDKIIELHESLLQTRSEAIKERSDKITLLESYSNFLTDHGYLDTDWQDEPPYAIDEFLKEDKEPTCKKCGDTGRVEGNLQEPDLPCDCQTERNIKAIEATTKDLDTEEKVQEFFERAGIKEGWKQGEVRGDIDCPKCGEHHIDKGEWAKRLHRKHQCEKCNHIWKPYDHYTFGI